MQATLVDGKSLAEQIRADIKQTVRTLNFKPKLAVVLVGEDVASQIYVKKKQQACEDVGIESQTIRYDGFMPERELIRQFRPLGWSNYWWD